MAKIFMFGVSRAGKTCYLYAMSQIMDEGARLREDNFRIQIKANDLVQAEKLNEGYMSLVSSTWPRGSAETTIYDFRVALQTNEAYYDNFIPNLALLDYKGGVWTLHDNTNVAERRRILNAFSESSALIFLVDGETLIHAMDPVDRDVVHRGMSSNIQILDSRNQIRFIENIFYEYKRKNTIIPPVLVAITKSDIFASPKELNAGKSYLKETLSSIFAIGSGIDAAITSLSLGENLSGKAGEKATGKFCLNTEHGIHLPMVFGIYAILSEGYDDFDPVEQKTADTAMRSMQKMMRGKVEMIDNGKPVFEVL
jgi:hypothetical protein